MEEGLSLVAPEPEEGLGFRISCFGEGGFCPLFCPLLWGLEGILDAPWAEEEKGFGVGCLGEGGFCPLKEWLVGSLWVVSLKEGIPNLDVLWLLFTFGLVEWMCLENGLLPLDLVFNL